MKKIIVISILLLIIIIPIIIYLLSKNNNSPLLDNKINCYLKENYSELNFTVETNVEIEHDDNDVVKIVTISKTITNENKTELDKIKTTTIEDLNRNNNTFGGLTYSFIEAENSITIKEEYDYQKLNLEKFVTIYPGLINSIIDDYMLATGLKMYYQDLKFTCE